MSAGKHHGRLKAKRRNAHINPMRPRPLLRRDEVRPIEAARGEPLARSGLPALAEMTV